MRFKDVFSIIGPVMVGPSSSHTAGAVRLGRVARALLEQQPKEAVITLYGSFAATGQGHGTDAALVGGLLGYCTDDERLPDALDYAEDAGIGVAIRTGQAPNAHPNTVRFALSTEAGEVVTATGCSIGGGTIKMTEVNGFSVNFSASFPTIVIQHADMKGMVASISRTLEKDGLNISRMSVDRKGRNGDALTVIETDEPPSEDTLQELQSMATVRSVRLVHVVD